MGVREHYIVMLTIIIHPPLPGDHQMLTDTWGRGPDVTMMGLCGVWRSDHQSFVFQPWGINLVHCVCDDATLCFSLPRLHCAADITNLNV